MPLWNTVRYTFWQSNMACWKFHDLWMIFPLTPRFMEDFPASHVSPGIQCSHGVGGSAWLSWLWSVIPRLTSYWMLVKWRELPQRYQAIPEHWPPTGGVVKWRMIHSRLSQPSRIVRSFLTNMVLGKEIPKLPGENFKFLSPSSLKSGTWGLQIDLQESFQVLGSHRRCCDVRCELFGADLSHWCRK